jgi:hypothetical protein
MGLDNFNHPRKLVIQRMHDLLRAAFLDHARKAADVGEKHGRPPFLALEQDGFAALEKIAEEAHE